MINRKWFQFGILFEKLQIQDIQIQSIFKYSVYRPQDE
jgi:hypothetical protein